LILLILQTIAFFKKQKIISPFVSVPAILSAAICIRSGIKKIQKYFSQNPFPGEKHSPVTAKCKQ
jgi:hypothetical protein